LSLDRQKLKIVLGTKRGNCTVEDSTPIVILRRDDWSAVQ
jgi:hypothetical protein